MKESEKTAEMVLRKVFPDAEILQRDTGTGTSVRDFDVIKDLEVVAAVEVTETTRKHERALEAELEDSGYEIPAERVQGTWLVFLAPGNGKRRDRAEGIDNCLARFEELGVEHFNATVKIEDNMNGRETQEFCQARQLGVLWASQVSLEGARIIVTSGAGEVFCSCKDYVNPRVEELAWACDNRRKLGAPDCARRILFVIVDMQTDYQCWKQVVDYRPADTPPRLPPEITEAWVTARNRDGNFVVWRACSERWEPIGIF